MNKDHLKKPVCFRHLFRLRISAIYLYRMIPKDYHMIRTSYTSEYISLFLKKFSGILVFWVFIKKEIISISVLGFLKVYPLYSKLAFSAPKRWNGSWRGFARKHVTSFLMEYLDSENMLFLIMDMFNCTRDKIRIYRPSILPACYKSYI